MLNIIYIFSDLLAGVGLDDMSLKVEYFFYALLKYYMFIIPCNVWNFLFSWFMTAAPTVNVQVQAKCLHNMEHFIFFINFYTVFFHPNPDVMGGGGGWLQLY